VLRARSRCARPLPTTAGSGQTARCVRAGPLPLGLLWMFELTRRAARQLPLGLGDLTVDRLIDPLLGLLRVDAHMADAALAAVQR
jgi:hypothetical protein